MKVKKARNSTTHTPTDSRLIAAGSATYCRNAAMSRAAWSNCRGSIRPGVAAEQGQAWFGKAPPDLSLAARARASGPDWVYTYLKSFYVDETRPIGWNNTLFPGVSMPNALWELQGIQRPVYGEGHGADAHVEKLELATPGRMDAREFDQAARDIAAFLQYVAEPAAMKREAVGVWVVLFLAFFTFIAYLLKLEYWRDVH